MWSIILYTSRPQSGVGHAPTEKIEVQSEHRGWDVELCVPNEMVLMNQEIVTSSGGFFCALIKTKPEGVCVYVP